MRSLQSMEAEEQDQVIDPEVTFEEYQQLFSITRESTASSPSGVHMGHYKVGALFPEIGIVLAKIMSYPLYVWFLTAKMAKVNTHDVGKDPGQAANFKTANDSTIRS